MLSIALTFALAASPPAGTDRLKTLSGQVGKQFDGKVIQVMEQGAFVDVGGATGLVHVDDMGFTGEKDPGKLVKVGQVVKVTIVSVDLEKKRMALSMRRDEDDPWRKVPAKYPVGTKVKATVLESSVTLGVFLNLEPTVDAFVHSSDLPPGKVVADFKPGQVVEIRVTNLDLPRKRVSASMR